MCFKKVFLEKQVTKLSFEFSRPKQVKMLRLAKIMPTHIVWKNTLSVSFEFWHFPSIFVLLKLTVWQHVFGFQKFALLAIFCIFNGNVNVARFARNVEWDFFCDFQTL